MSVGRSAEICCSFNNSHCVRVESDGGDRKRWRAQLTDLALSAGEASQAGAGEGGVSCDAVVDALASVQARPQVRTHRRCAERSDAS